MTPNVRKTRVFPRKEKHIFLKKICFLSKTESLKKKIAGNNTDKFVGFGALGMYIYIYIYILYTVYQFNVHIYRYKYMSHSHSANRHHLVCSFMYSNH